MEAARYLVALLLLAAPLAALPEGIAFDLGNTVAVIGNPSGGLRQGIVYSGSTYLDVLFDLEKLARFDDLIFHASFCVRQGQSLTSECILKQLQDSVSDCVGSRSL
ncbi:MAG: hypothetical protein KDK48_00165 [Chlamydiia bacterium]|nr:hypothetical protein [Chlamydiia bacterium]